MLVLSEPVRGVRGDAGLHILCNKTFVKDQNKEILDWLGKLSDNKVVALGTKACNALEGSLSKVTLTSL